MGCPIERKKRKLPAMKSERGQASVVCDSGEAHDRARPEFEREGGPNGDGSRRCENRERFARFGGTEFRQRRSHPHLKFLPAFGDRSEAPFYPCADNSDVAAIPGAVNGVRRVGRREQNRLVLAAEFRVFQSDLRRDFTIDGIEVELIPPKVLHDWWKRDSGTGISFTYESRGVALPDESAANGRGEDEVLRGEVLAEQTGLLTAKFGQSVVAVPRSGLTVANEVESTQRSIITKGQEREERRIRASATLRKCPIATTRESAAPLFNLLRIAASAKDSLRGIGKASLT